MSDLISRADAIEAVCRTRCGDKAKGCPAHSCLVIEEFDALLSADAVDGEWKEVEDYNGDVHYKCDQCGEEWTFPFGTPIENNANYCPCCGARMKGGEE